MKCYVQIIPLPLFECDTDIGSHSIVCFSSVCFCDENAVFSVNLSIFFFEASEWDTKGKIVHLIPLEW